MFSPTRASVVTGRHHDRTRIESYDYIDGFSKPVAKTAATLELSSLPAGHGFQFELKLTDSTENASKPILDRVSLAFGE